MGPKKEKLPSEESMEEAPDVSDSRVYSDFILYFVKSGRFQYHPLVDEKRRRGVLSLMGTERVTKLTLERRLSPLNMRLTPGEPRQKVYLFAIVRQAVTSDQLDDIIRRLNDSLDGKTTEEKEAAVLELIYSTSSRVRPGIKFLPMYFYATETYTAPDVDDQGREIDNQGLPVIQSEDEVVAIQGGSRDRSSQRGNGYVSLPSTSTRLSDPSTDSEGMMGPSKGRRRQPKRPTEMIDWETASVAANKRKGKASDEDAPPAKRPDVVQPETETPEVVPEHEVQIEQPPNVPEQPGRSREQSVITISDDVSEPSHAAVPGDMDEIPEIAREDVILADLPPEIRSREDVIEMQRELNDLRLRVGTFEEFMDEMKRQQMESKDKGRARSSRASTRDRDSTPPMYTDEESRARKYFPINNYTRAMDWFLRQPAVQTLIYYEVMRVTYRTYPVFKPDAEFMIAKYMDYLMSTRLQTHLAKANGNRGRANMDFGRAPMPNVVVQIAETRLTDLAKRRVPGFREVADVMKDRCGAARRNKVIECDYVSTSSSVEVMAHRLYNERMTFAEANEWLLRDNKRKTWTYADELKKTKGLESGKKKPSDPTFDGKHEPFDPYLEERIFPDMDKGEDLNDMDEAKELARALENSPVSKPVFPQEVWELIRMVVEPTPADRAAAMVSKEKKDKNRVARQDRRKSARKARKNVPLSEDENSDEEMDEDADDFRIEPHISPTQPTDEPQPSTSGMGSGGAKGKQVTFKDTGAIPKKSSASPKPPTSEELFGSTSDISSSNSSGKVKGQVTQEGTMVYTMESAEAGENEPEPEHDPITVETQPGAAAVILQTVTNTGFAKDTSEVGIATNTTTSTESQYSVIVTDTPRAGPSVLRGQSDSRVKRSETLTRPSRERTPYQQYEDMEIDMIDQGAMEGQSSSDSSNKDSSKSNDDSNVLSNIMDTMQMPPPAQDSATANIASRQMQTQDNQAKAEMEAKKEAARNQARTRLGMGRTRSTYVEKNKKRN